MKLVLLSGGSGKRLWPLSNDTRSKQFLKVLKSKNGDMQSMVQRVWGQLEEVGLASSAFVATGASQVDMLQAQLGGEVPLIVEPERRDTFPAIALAASYLFSVAGVDTEETVTVLPVDPYVDTAFFEKLHELDSALSASGAELALMGVAPTYPSEKYGYIVPSPKQYNEGAGYLEVSHFTEKPDEEQAKDLIEQGALWNCGVFAFRLGLMLDLLMENGWPISYQVLLESYGDLPKISFDYQVVEKASNVVALPYEGEWKDLGTWNTLTEEMDMGVIGKGIVYGKSSNAHLINELGIPVIIMGLSDIVVAASPDGVLIADKAASPAIKNVVKQVEGQRPMYEERRWGWYRVLDYHKTDDGQQVLTKRIGIAAGRNLSYQIHRERNEVWTIVQGEGMFALNDRIYPVKPGDVLQIPKGAKHAIYAETDLEFIEVQMGSELIEEDITRLCMTWDEIKAICVQTGGLKS
jgi:mannose-1-phosphate guanylyltransferase